MERVRCKGSRGLTRYLWRTMSDAGANVVLGIYSQVFFDRTGKHGKFAILTKKALYVCVEVQRDVLKLARILFLFKRMSYLAALLIVVGAVAGYSSPVRLMPTPVKFTTGQIDPFEQSISAGDGTTISLLYATNRAVLVETR